jgi:sulfur-carrier protein
VRIELRLYASLARYMPSGPDAVSAETMEVAKGTSVRAVLEGLGVPLAEVKMIFLNGIHAKADELLSDGDRVGVFPPVAGG